MDYNETLSIENICGGAVSERFERELHEVLKNISDPNTDAEQKRTITLEFQFKPFPDRSGAQVLFSCKGKLAAAEGVAGSVFFAKQGALLRAYAHDPRQEQLFGTEKSIRDQKAQ
jgi:hypothetical protein